MPGGSWWDTELQNPSSFSPTLQGQVLGARMGDRCVHLPGTGGPPGALGCFWEGMSVFAPPHKDSEHDQESLQEKEHGFGIQPRLLQTLA